MMVFRPRSRKILSSWWWTIDRVTLFAILSIITFGMVLIATASPYVANRIGGSEFHFVEKQFIFMSLSLVTIFIFSLMNPVLIKRISLLGFLIGIAALITVLMVGQEIKGARRWISIMGISIQPSEFIKPFFIVISAWFLSLKNKPDGKIAYRALFVLYIILVSLLISQPDFGMTVLVSCVFAAQLFLAGLPMSWIIIGIALFITGIVAAYHFLPHVALRINSFLSPDEKSYQGRKSLDAISEGGFFGKGPGEGTVKQVLPDSHTDFIFAVAAEEMGILFCCLIITLFATVVIRSFIRIMHERDFFILYASYGLVVQFGLQAVVNMGGALDLLPTKGMTLPFISYGGSSLIALSITVGMLLCLTRKRYRTRLLNRGM